MQETFGVESRLIKGDNGIFEVVVDGKTVFSKYAAGRFPDPGEVVRALGSRSA